MQIRYHRPLPSLQESVIHHDSTPRKKSHVPGWIGCPAILFVRPRQSAIRSETLCHRLQFNPSLNEELNNGATSRFEAYLLITIS